MGDEREELPRANRGPAAAAENRRALIAAAREVFAESGYSVAFSVIARRAGVGQGSLYRHFPTKLALATAVFEDDIDEMERIASAPDSTFDDLLDRVVSQAAVSAALVEALSAERDRAEVAGLGGHLLEVVDRMLARDIADGRVAEGVTGYDAFLAISMLARVIAGAPPEQRDDVAERTRRIVAEGVRPRG